MTNPSPIDTEEDREFYRKNPGRLSTVKDQSTLIVSR